LGSRKKKCGPSASSEKKKQVTRQKGSGDGEKGVYRAFREPGTTEQGKERVKQGGRGVGGNPSKQKRSLTVKGQKKHRAKPRRKKRGIPPARTERAEVF